MPFPGGGFNHSSSTVSESKSESHGASGSWSDGYGASGSWGDNGSVERCGRVADIPLNDYIGLEHEWIRTDVKEAGMGPAEGGVPGADGQTSNDSPYVTETRINDHAGEGDKPGSHCEPVNNVDAACVNESLEIGKDLGRWSPWNNCNTFVDEVLEKCEIQPSSQANHTDVPNLGDSDLCNPTTQADSTNQVGQNNAGICDSSTQSCPTDQTGQGNNDSCDSTTQSCPPDQSGQNDSGGIHDGQGTGGDSDCYTEGPVTECGPSSIESSSPSGSNDSSSNSSTGSDSSSSSSSSSDSSSSGAMSSDSSSSSSSFSDSSASSSTGSDSAASSTSSSDSAV